MRRITTSVLVSLMVLGLASCGGGSKQTESSSSGTKKSSKKCASCESKVDELQAELEEPRKLIDRHKQVRKMLEDDLAGLLGSGGMALTTRQGMLTVRISKDVLFGSKQTKLTNEGKRMLKSVASALSDIEDHRILVAGHTNNISVGNKGAKAPNNMKLSIERGHSAAKFLMDQGISKKGLGVTGFGATDPIASNSSTKGRNKNQRVEMVLVPDLSGLMSGGQSSSGSGS